MPPRKRTAAATAAEDPKTRPEATASSVDDTADAGLPAPDARAGDAPAVPAAARRPTALKVHHLRPAPGARKARMRIGRGEGSKGQSSGRGTKGSKARTQVSARFEGGQMPLHMRIPKLKGFKNRFRTSYQVVNLDRLCAQFPDGGQVGPDELAAAGLVRRNALVKVLGDGDLTVALQVSAHAFSATARDKIAAAGGEATQL